MTSKGGRSTSSATAVEKQEPKAKIDPSFKSKRYRDKLRTEVKALEALLPVDRTSLSRKLDSQTVFRLVIALLRTKGYFKAIGRESDQTETHPTARHSYDISSRGVDTDDDVLQLIQGHSCLQVLDGFLLLLTADGTILYVSDNVLQYLGYNQVDLMHRCLYSVVHQDDMMDLKMVLETSLSHLGTPYDRSGAQDSSQPVEDCSLGTGEMCRSLSFICRMRCFSGSSVGYLKMHCSGKIVHQLAGLPKNKRSSNDVVLLFCNPFMLRATEFSTDLQKNVFWSKHDLDLNIKEMDKMGAEIIGYHTEELEKKSFYSLIHPEDLTALTTCHRMLVDSSEVQTVHFRLQTKGGDWVWLTSRGKVISKNAKKFSIAFSHCPLREEDSTYIQQEAIIRRRYAISDLMCLTQFKQTVPSSLGHNMSNEEKHPASKSKKMDQSRYHPYSVGSCTGIKSSKSESKKEETGVLDASCILEVSCPSAWHAMADRHSPVLPSSHVAHKISQREKQLQFQEFCRRQQMEINNPSKFSSSWDVGSSYSVPPSDNVPTSCSSVQSMLPPTGASQQLPTAGNPSSACYYSSDSHLPSFGSPHLDYSFSHMQNNSAATYFHHWYSSVGAGSDAMINQSPATCLTPSRSPHQCTTVSVPFHGAVPSQCSLQPVAAPRNPNALHITQSVSAPYSGMPPSPPPSPPSLFKGPVSSFQHSWDVTHGNSHPAIQPYHRSEWFSAQQPYFGYPTSQPSLYPRNCLLSGMSTSLSSANSTISNLEKTADKFLSVKTELACEKNKNISVDQQDKPVPSLYGKHTNHSRSDRCGRPIWNFNSSANSGRKLPVVHQTHFRQVNGNGFACTDHITPVKDHSQTSLSHELQENQIIQTHNFLHNSSSQNATQYMTYPFTPPHSSLGFTPPHSSLVSSTAYPYGMYQSLNCPGGQYSVKRFYTAQVVPVKGPTDFPQPFIERPLDLPSIGSFLEYLNEV